MFSLIYKQGKLLGGLQYDEISHLENATSTSSYHMEI